MSVDVTQPTDLTPEEWNRLVERAEYTDGMHQWEALEVIAEHANATVHHLVGYKGQEPVGVFPLFARRYGPVESVFSPPPSLRTPYLGPGLLNMEKLKPRKTEHRHQRFLEGVLSWVDSRFDPGYLHVRCAPDYPDARPFAWNDCEVTPLYTYHVDITAAESTLLERFSRDARTNIRGDPEVDYEIREGDRDALDRIYDQVRARYESQDVTYEVPRAFVRDLYDETPEGTVRPYECRVDGEFVGGILALEFGDTIARWQGGVKPDGDHSLPTNDLLDWALIRAGRERDRTTYDLVGAETPRINDYKLKFSPELVPYYSIERSSRLGHIASQVYKRVK